MPATVADKPPVIGVLEFEHNGQYAQADANFSAAIDLLGNAGYKLQPVTIPDLDLYTDLQQVIVKSEGAAMHGRALRENDTRMSHAVRSVIEGGLLIPAVRYIEALALRSSLLQSFVENVLAAVDVLILPVSMPSAPIFTPQIDLQASEIDRQFSRMATMTRFANYLGVPAISLPSGVNADRIPSGLLTGEMIETRSKARGLSETDYMSGNLLGREVTAGDVASAFVGLALADKTTGAVLTVDGGNIAAAMR